MKRKLPKFRRVDSHLYSRLGKGRPKLLKWRRARGKQNKIRLKRRGYFAAPSIGYKSPRKISGLVRGMKPILVHNIKELQALSKDNIAILARIGAKKKMEILKKADELKINVLNASSKEDKK
ncbi:MAG: eL32 family ribosomal protein [Candidatus Pacearchaeota archaeon]